MYATVELFLDKPLKIIFLVDEDNEKKMIQLINIR